SREELCKPILALKPKVRRIASCTRSSVNRPFSSPSFIHWKSSSGSLKHKNKSHPASIVVGHISRRGNEVVIATMCEASVKILLFNPTLPRNNSSNKVLFNDAGKKSSSSRSGCNTFSYSGK